ncbi:MAG: hypothetical protein ACLGIO_15095, partial [Acidimicrobiia bacterium]
AGGAARAVRGLSAPSARPGAASPRPPVPTGDRAPGRARAAPAARPVPPRVAPVVVERPHRVRSAVGLLAIAVLVGAMVAALVTVAVFALGVALRRAVG